MRQVSLPARAILLLVIAAGFVPAAPLDAQIAAGGQPILEPGIQGVRVHPGALAPNRRKWFLPQGLYYEYGWRAWEYSNYARDQYERYVSITHEGSRYYDNFGNYIGRGWGIYDWTETSPIRHGSTILKGPKFSGWFSNLVISSAHHGQFHTALMVGEAIRTTLTPLTFSKPAFNGLQWDFLSDHFAVTLLGSRLNSPATSAINDASPPTAVENSTRVLGGRGVVQVTDFAKLGFTWISAHNATSELSLGNSSLKGVLTGYQNLGNVEQVVIRITDDSPDTPESGAALFVDEVLLDGEVHPEIVPTVRGGVRREGILEVSGVDAIELIYDIHNSFKQLDPDGLTSSSDAQSLEFRLVVANDYRIEVTSNLTKNVQEQDIYLPVARAPGEVRDGSNQRFVSFDYGVPTGNEFMGVDIELVSLGGLDLRGEYVVNNQYRRFPNENYRKLPAASDNAGAGYLTASYVNYPWFAYGEAYTMDENYNTSVYMADPGGRIDYDNERSYRFELVDDNDDQDQHADWIRLHQSGSGDSQVFPGLDENNDFISDYNQNRNAKPDYAEPFLRYAVDAPEFLFGMDMNNNTIIDRFEDDNQPDYPYDRDLRGYNAYGGLRLSEDIQFTAGYVRERQPSSSRRNRTAYGLASATLDKPKWSASLFEHIKHVQDDIPDDRLVWDDEVRYISDYRDPLELQDTFVNSTYFEGTWQPLAALNMVAKAKYERYHQLGDQADDPLLQDRWFLGVINKADYTLEAGDRLSFWPRWKSEFRREVPTLREDPDIRQVTESLVFTGRYSLLPTMWVHFGLENNRFYNLIDRPLDPPAGYQEDYTSWVWALLLANTSDYLGYRLTMNAGFQLERQELPAETQTESRFFLRLYAASSDL
jgi:hypothetical protein